MWYNPVRRDGAFMYNSLGKNIYELRKKHKLTQEDLAGRLNVSFQAVSKWENGASMPDISMLPAIADQFKVSIDTLLNYAVEQRNITAYEKRYEKAEYYWGVRPNSMCYEVLKLMPPERPLRLLDIGCGEGKDAVFFAKNGYTVSAFDIASNGIEKAKRLADKHCAEVNFFRADLLDFRLETQFDILFCSGVLHYIPPQKRGGIFENFKEYTAEGGINALNVFVEKPFIEKSKDEEIKRSYWKTGELMHIYYDWLIHSCNEIIFDCNSGGSPHKHCMDILIAEKTGESI